ncbi:hypothetical protein HPB48_016631 [Haemaphysalis longicornis]|uniref:Uncharacterized protein n=1 Tax=Haemaphysalis longicornis TaxID=44386 RepID=A0A9J6FV41_HAELO|nr:hypothetical protein HPB48_016631 [Haemaphysalis longicornis]
MAVSPAPDGDGHVERRLPTSRRRTRVGAVTPGPAGTIHIGCLPNPTAAAPHWKDVLKLPVSARRPKSGLTHMTCTTRIFHVIPSTPTSLEAIPHQATLNGCPILIEVPGRPSLCLRGYHTGHYRKNCSTPWCRACRAYGHDQNNCTQSYVSRAKQRTPARNLEEYMDADDMAAMMSTEGPEAATHPPPPLQASPHVPSPPVNTAGRRRMPAGSKRPLLKALQGKGDASDAGASIQMVSDRAHESGRPRELNETVAEPGGKASLTNAKPAADEEQRSEEAKPADVEGEEAAPLNDQPGETSFDDADDELPTKAATAPRRPDNIR